jgi:short-subunit dehydrogenase
MVDLIGKAVIVTGASSGIGASLARAFSTKGARVTLTARRQELLHEVAHSCRGETLVVPSDLTKDKDREFVVKKTLDRWGKIDILVNNAGLGIYGDFLSVTKEDWRKVFEINLFSAVFLSRSVLMVMRSQGAGVIINIASIGGLIAHSDKVTPYVSSKHALVGFSRGLAKDLEGSSIRVLAVCPHLTATDFFSSSHGAKEMAPLIEKLKISMDTPDDVAAGILEKLDSDKLVVFPTARPVDAYRKHRDL